MKKYNEYLTVAFGGFMILGGVAHFLMPELYIPFIPDFLPIDLINYLSGFAEIIIGIGTITKKFRSLATLGIFLLMIAFLPLHVIDVFSENPAIGSKALAYFRLPMQSVLIYWAWYIYKIEVKRINSI